MAVLRGLLWLLGAVALIVVAMYITGNYELSERLTGLFLAVQPWLPLTVNFDHFLILFAVLGLLVTALVLGGSTAIFLLMGGKLFAAQQRELGQATAAKREISHIKEQHLRQYEQLISLAQTLTKRLDKRVLVQAIVDAASRIASVAQTNGVVSVWLLNLETDTIRFEMGRYCDEAIFTRPEFQPTETPFAQVITTQKTQTVEAWPEVGSFIKKEKAAQLGSATSAILVPLVIENSVLGVLVLCCHPDILKSYEEQRPFYDAMWAELGLALAIAIQGEMAILDRLTGVHNREYFMKRLVQDIERANRYHLPLSLLMIDIDNFKLVNDMLGHPQGDAVLRIVAKLVKKEVRAIDLVGRYGGEEFIIMLPDTGYGEEVTTATGSRVVGERIRKAVDEEFCGLQKPLNLTISVGLAVRRFPEDREMDFQELIRLADEQLYRAKTTGKNKVCAFTPEQPHPSTPQAA